MFTYDNKHLRYNQACVQLYLNHESIHVRGEDGILRYSIHVWSINDMRTALLPWCELMTVDEFIIKIGPDRAIIYNDMFGDIQSRCQFSLQDILQLIYEAEPRSAIHSS